MKTAYHVIRMIAKGKNRIIGGLHGYRPGEEAGIKVSYANNAPVQGSGYRLTATDIDGNKAVTKPCAIPQMVQEVIEDLRKQKRRIGAKIEAKVADELSKLKEKYPSHSVVTAVLLFKEDKYHDDRIIARYGFGIDDRNGIIVFGTKGVMTGQQFVQIIFPKGQSFGLAVPVTDSDRIDTVIDDLQEQINLAEEYSRYGYTLPEADKPSGEAKRMLRAFSKQCKSAAA